MRPRERRDSGQGDFLRWRLDAILDLDHPLVALARKMDWAFLDKRFGEAYRDGPGQPPLPTRLMAGLTILIADDLSDEALCARARWRTPIISSSAGRSFSSTSWSWTAAR